MSASSPSEAFSSEKVGNLDAPDSPPESSHVERPRAGSQGAPAGRAGGDAKTNFGAPGSSYQTKKFAEEYEKVEAQLLDRQWENAYGDVFGRGE
ncbi:unnamed protein product [Diplocarpon coronariae]|uniref:Uncharacterized protein n=1 Tax=Diplocarpon coronariae TaxID=2795749 RepID=A0A218Z344_9HELO|nr:hypothetical protein B2J93_5214 [Marssonina coronariae]